MSDAVKIEGLEAALRRVSPERAAAETRRLLRRITLTVERKTKIRTPVRKAKRGGTLRRSITSVVEGSRGIVGTNVNYARFVHEGTRRMQRRPFLRWGLEDSRGDIAREVDDAARRIFEE